MKAALIALLLLAPSVPQAYDYTALANYNAGSSTATTFFYRCGPAEPSWRALIPGRTTRAACPSGTRLQVYTPFSALTCYRSDPDRQVTIPVNSAGRFGRRKTGTWSCLNAS